MYRRDIKETAIEKRIASRMLKHEKPEPIEKTG